MLLVWLVFLLSLVSFGLCNTEKCCTVVGDAYKLLECQRAESIQIESNVSWLTTVSLEIYSFASKALLNNNLILAYHGLSLRIHDSSIDPDFFGRDRRWNKVMAAKVALETWAMRSKYLVVIDADLILLDWKFTVDAFLQQHVSASIIVGADSMDLANTGFMIIRNDHWAAQFLQKWWAARELPEAHCDQHVLNYLISTLSKEERALIAIVPAKALNSVWPVLENFEDTDPVLHLMGETNSVREAIASYVVADTCSHHNAERLPADPIVEASRSNNVPNIVRVNVSKPILLTLRHRVLLNEYEQALQQCQQDNNVGGASSEEDYLVLHGAVDQLCASNKRGAGWAIVAECDAIIKSAASLHEAELQYFSQKRLRGQHTVFHASQLVSLSLLSLELHSPQASEPPQRSDSNAESVAPGVLIVAQQAMYTIDRLAALLDSSAAHSRVFLHQKRAAVFAQLVTFFQARRQWPHALDQGMAAITELGSALEMLVPSHDPRFPGVVTDYIHSARRLSESFQYLSRLSEAAEWAEIALNNAQILFNSTFNEQRVLGKLLREALSQRVKVARALGDKKTAKLHLKAMKSLDAMFATN